MKIFIRMKSAGKRRPLLENVPYEIPEGITTLRELLTALVQIEVEKYNQKGMDVQVLPFLTEQELEEGETVGKVGFGRIYSEKKADVEKATENALQCYEDGLVRVFLNDAELTETEEKVSLQEGDHLTLIRLTFLAGRLW